MSLSQKLTDWTVSDLSRFIVSAMRTTKAALPPSLVVEELTTTKRLVVDDQIQLSPQAVAQLKTYLGLP